MGIWTVYILVCADGSLYTGITVDLIRRCKQHNSGTGSRYTRSRLPTSLAYSESQETKSGALKREAAVKRLKRGQKLALIVGLLQVRTPCEM